MMDETTIAAMIAEWLESRDDIAFADAEGNQVSLRTQAGESYILLVAPADA